jgi:hypothetical protein
MVADILQNAFARSRERVGLIFLDVLWKAVWFICGVAAIVLVAAWFGSELRDLAWDDTGTRAMNALIAAEALREFWNSMKGEIVLFLLLTFSVVAAAWFVLEAFVRSRIISAVAGFSPRLSNSGGRGLKPAATCFIARVAKTFILTTAALVLVVVWTNGAPLIAAALFLLLAFCLTVVETLIRADAVELLGTDLIRVTALIGILMSFEMMVAASFVVMLAAGFLNVARLGEALAMLGITGVVAVVLTLLHSYLLLVRFSAVSIMRQNVVAV